MLARAKQFFNAPRVGVTAPWRLFWVAFAVRLLYMTLAHTYRIRGYEDHFNFAWEAGRIGKALATGYGYADPFSNIVVAHTGPTAWLPPLYPLLIAAIFNLFGIYTATSAWVLLAINCAFSAITAMAVWEIGARCYGRRNAVWAGWLWALHPAAMQYAVRWVWEMSITTALFAWVIVVALRMRGIEVEGTATSPRLSSRQTGQWALFGVAWGLIALSNATLLLFLPVCGLWILMGSWHQPQSRRQGLLGALVAALIFIVCITPWTVRNYAIFHTFLPLRGNFGAELYMGDGPGSTGLLMVYDHPHVAPEQLKLYAAMGEVRYVAMRGAAAKRFIHSNPAHFVAICVKRIYFFWASVPSDNSWAVEAGRVLNYGSISLCGLFGLALALHRKSPAAGLFAWAFLLLPLTYYLVTVHARFRHPLEPLICVLGVYLFQSAERTRVSRR